ncbi:MAG: bifunctional glutamate N-acetyltransferase/amino-acid acetyltransferase ArgJ [Desulfovibrionales bacterium]|nr:bifunctional glutamate N-acetyltransferase/amino-acid acetyltransferase ArgJ [Desulfovibrionales bacterium]
MGKNNQQIKGFLFSATGASIKKPGRLDVGLIYAEKPAVAAGVFTRNRVKAAPVIISRERLRRGAAQAILVNSGNANACTGEQGLEDARESARVLAKHLEIKEKLALVASTGVIGQFLPMERIKGAIPRLAQSLAPNRLAEVSRAILTTDKMPKTAFREGNIDGVPIRMAAIAKGAGMIMPQMATMLCFVMTDVAIRADALRASLHRAVSLSFNRITVDGDMSTNDSVIILASGEANNKRIDIDDSAGRSVFEKLLGQLLIDLARMIVRDGEGATKLVEVRVTGAGTVGEARKAAYAVANSSLVKTALFGEDANWGRIMAALGRSGVPMDPGRVSVAINTFPLVKNGLGCGPEAEMAATGAMRQEEFILHIDLDRGPCDFNVWTCDLSEDYVRINASYRS